MRRPVQFGKYLLLDRISVGGMAEVFKAKSFGVQGFEKVIAIKRILPSMGSDEEFIKMFIDEAKIAGQLAHANIGQIHELGRIEGAHFIAMEYIWGRDLLQFQNRYKKLKKRMSVTAACFIVMKICEGLHYAHKKRDVLGTAMDIVHRDCSPQNVVLSYEGEVKLIDFGIARAASRSARTQAGVLKGKFGYMSPEQVRGLPLDRRSDIFSLGTILYECLAGKRLFSGESDFSTLEKVRNAEVDMQVLKDLKVPQQVLDIVLKSLKRAPDDRYQWCSDMRDDIRNYLQTMEEVYTYRTLGEEMRRAFASELEREQQLMDIYSKLGHEGLPEDLAQAQILVGGDESSIEGLEEIGAPVLKDSALALGSKPRRATTGTDDFEDNPTEIFGEFGVQDFLSDSVEEKRPDRLGSDHGEPKVQVAELRESSAPSSLPHGTPAPGGTAQIPRNLLVDPHDDGVTPIGITPLPRPVRAANPSLPPPGRRPPPLTTTHPAKRANRDILIGVSIALATVLLFIAVKTIFFGSSEAGGEPPRATLVVLTGDKEPAEVFLGDNKVGAVPAGEALTVDSLKPGKYDIRVAREGLMPCVGKIEIGAERVEVFNCEFTKAILILDDLHEGDQVVIDGKNVAAATLRTGLTMQAGRAHLVAVTREGQLIDEFDITLEDQEKRRRTVVRDKLKTDEEGGEETLEMQPDLVEAKDEGEADDERSGKSSDRERDRENDSPRTGAGALLGLESGNDKNDRENRKPKPELQAPELEDPEEAKDPPQEEQPVDKFGYLTAWTRPWARIYVDGKDTGKVTPIAPAAKIKLKPGVHKVTFMVGSKPHHFSVTIKAGKESKLAKILE